ncbi:MAG: methyltransferase regulatory domain-containing protein [Sphingomonadaceae bacterium]
MTDWTAGYVADIAYTYGYYTELNPLHMRLAFLQAGVAFPEVGTACELGFGQGVSTNLHAAASITHWFGTDFNPAQAAYAQELRGAAGSDAQLFDEGFDAFCQRDDLPKFDYIALHGIWSWISDENRAVIVDFIRRKLNVGGVLYISYNTQPGWAAMVPLRDLLTQHSEVMSAPAQGIVTRIDSALDFANKLMSANPKFAQANPLVADRLTELKGQNRNYLAHEYFNRDWLPMPFSRMAEWLSPTKLNYVCSANYIDHIDALTLTTEQQNLLKDIAAPMFRETVRDFCVNQQFRRDFWVNGLRTLNPIQQAQQLRQQLVVLIQPRAEVTLKVKGGLGEASMQEAIYAPILDALADHQAKTLGQIEQLIAGNEIQLSQLTQAIMILCGTGAVTTAQPPLTPQRNEMAKALNLYLCRQACAGGEVAYLTSPVTGGGVPVSHIQQMFIHAREQGAASVQQWAHHAWNALTQQGKRLLKEGKALESDAATLAELEQQASAFAAKQLPILQALQVL